MSSVALPSRGQCIQITDNLQLCQCPSFASTFDQNICGRCGHGIHAHHDYVSMFVHHCPGMNCAAYYPKTPRVQACTCSASLIEHMPVMNIYRSPAILPFEAGTHPSNDIMFTGDATNTPFTPVPMPAPSTNSYPSHSYGEIVAPTPQSVIQTAITPIDAHSHSVVENFYGAQYQDDHASAINNVHDPGARLHEDYPTTYVPVHGTEAWAGQVE
ncbi:hypothetical protein IW261DRAFT_527228 [Armillaria novae-zelandiae]|uniref:Uncharacterized protein n=1 Tax=Armillaria novae-zelandiae TaxID=153914 RepID=A0AA39NZL5_9AGAR|nr:hypothetical protein IW261DRAFT_527228 [Armillaria novae-zelandiae]